MQEPPQVILTIRAIEYESGPIAFFPSVNEVTVDGFLVELSVPQGSLKLIVYEFAAINQEEVEFGFFNIDALGTLKMVQSGDATVPMFMKFKRYFIDEPLVQVFIVGFESDSKLIQFEISPFSVAQNGVTLKINKYAQTGLTKLMVTYVAAEQSHELAQIVTHTGAKTAAVGFEFVEMHQEEPEGEDDKVEEKKEHQVEHHQPKKIELVQLNGLNGLRFLVNPISFMWQGDKIEPTALNVNLRITLDKGNQAVLGLYYFEQKVFRKCPQIYQECGYQGSVVYICRNIPDFDRVFKMARSVRIPEKSHLVVYQDTSFTGVKTKIKESKECLSDWFEDAPQEDVADVQTLLQLNRYKKHGKQEVMMVQKSQKKNAKDYWKIQKQSFGIKMPQWYSYEKDGTIKQIEQEAHKHFEKIDEQQSIRQEKRDLEVVDEEDNNSVYVKGQQHFEHIDESAMF